MIMFTYFLERRLSASLLPAYLTHCYLKEERCVHTLILRRSQPERMVACDARQLSSRTLEADAANAHAQLDFPRFPVIPTHILRLTTLPQSDRKRNSVLYPCLFLLWCSVVYRFILRFVNVESWEGWGCGSWPVDMFSCRHVDCCGMYLAQNPSR